MVPEMGTSAPEANSNATITHEPPNLEIIDPGTDTNHPTTDNLRAGTVTSTLPHVILNSLIMLLSKTIEASEGSLKQ